MNESSSQIDKKEHKNAFMWETKTFSERLPERKAWFEKKGKLVFLYVSNQI